MIDSVYILQRDSGLPLLHVNLHPNNPGQGTPSELFSGVLQSIRLFLKEIKIGDLADFTTHNKRIEIHNEGQIVVAVIADIDDPPENFVELITQDISALFLAQYMQVLENFSGNVGQFDSFRLDILDYINLQLQDHIQNEKDPEIEVSQILDASSFGEWLKNQYNPSGKIIQNEEITLPPNRDLLHLDYIFDGGDRPMNTIDRWYTKKSFIGGSKFIVFVKILDATHGPAQILQIMTGVRELGNPKFRENPEIYPYFPYEIMFIGPTINKDSFRLISSQLRQYKNNQITTARYADHFHREHFPHHEFYRCRVSGWRWDLSTISPESIPQKIFP